MLKCLVVFTCVLRCKSLCDLQSFACIRLKTFLHNKMHSLICRSIRNFDIPPSGVFDETLARGLEFDVRKCPGDRNLNQTEEEGQVFEQKTKLFHDFVQSMS